jgi:hypothetical protein
MPLLPLAPSLPDSTDTTRPVAEYLSQEKSAKVVSPSALRLEGLAEEKVKDVWGIEMPVDGPLCVRLKK